MSRKRLNLLDDPPTACSSEEDEVDNSIEDDDMAGNSSTEEDDESSKNPFLKNTEASLAATLEKSVSDSGGQETDSDSGLEKKNQDSKKVKSSANSEAKRSSSEVDVDAASTDVKKVKRVREENEEKSGGGEETKKTYFQRVWSEDDEIALLQGLIDYKNATAVSPYDDTNGFYQMVKKSISFDVSKIQLMEKLRSLKKKYENNLSKAKKGEESTFAKSHDVKAFELSKFIWGVDDMALEPTVKSNGKSKKRSKLKKVESVKQEYVSSLPNDKNCEDEGMTNEEEVSLSDIPQMDECVNSELVKSLACFGLDDLAVRQGWSRLAVEDKNRFVEQWKVLQLREFEFFSQKCGIIHEVVTKMAETFGSIP